MSISTRIRIPVWAASIFTLTATALLADQLQMQNGDHYAGKILSVNSNSIVLESEMLGKLTLPRNKVSTLTFGRGSTTNTAPALPHTFASPAPSPKAAGTNTDLSAALHNLGANTNFIQQVRQQML